jgi:hypothetical protein
LPCASSMSGAFVTLVARHERKPKATFRRDLPARFNR